MSTIGCQPGEINVYDSLYTDVDENTKCKIEKALGSSINFSMATVQRQVGVTDCGVYAVTFVTNLAFGIESGFRFQQDSLRPHLQICFEQRCICPFP